MDQCLALFCYRYSSDKEQLLREPIGLMSAQIQTYSIVLSFFVPLMGSLCATFPITAVKQNVARTSLAADFKLLTCS